MQKNAKWSVETAWKWYEAQPWFVGCNFIPSTAINQIEMWQESSFDLQTIKKELGWAAAIGMNAVRAYLHNLVWQADPEGFKKRIAAFLDIAEQHGINVLFTIFDDCWNEKAELGKQPEPLPGVHNSGWVRSPGASKVVDTNAYAILKQYVQDIVSTFGRDNRIIMWDVYNEPGNSNLNEQSIPLLTAAFEWARECNPQQPLTSAVWNDTIAVQEVQLNMSDIITFHNYGTVEDMYRRITPLKVYGRPLMCTEYMARTQNSRFSTHLPVFKQEKIGCFNWGLVAGKTQTIYPWGSPEGAPEPAEWFHDIFTKEGVPHQESEVACIKNITGTMLA